MIQPSPLGHSAEFGETSAAVTDVEKIVAAMSCSLHGDTQSWSNCFHGVASCGDDGDG